MAKPKSPPKKVVMKETANKMADTTVEVLVKDRARRDKSVNRTSTEDIIERSKANQKEIQGMLNAAGDRKAKRKTSYAKGGGKGARNYK